MLGEETGGIGKAESHIKLHNMITCKDKHDLSGSLHHMSAFFFSSIGNSLEAQQKHYLESTRGRTIQGGDLGSPLRILARKYFVQELCLSCGSEHISWASRPTL